MSKGLSISLIFKDFYAPGAQTEFSDSSCIKPLFSRGDGNLEDNPVEKKSQASSEFVLVSREKWSREKRRRVENQGEGSRGRCGARVRAHTSPSFNSLTKDGLINKSITHTRGAGGMNAYRVDKDRGEDVDKIGGCPRVLVVEQRGARHGINVWPPRQNIHARSSAPAVPSPLIRGPGPTPSRPCPAPFLHLFSSCAPPMTVSGTTLKLSQTIRDH